MGLSLVVFILLYIVGLWLIRTPLRWLVRRTPTEFDDQFLDEIQTPLKVFVGVISLDFFIGRLDALTPENKQFLGDLLFIAYLILTFYVLWRLAQFTADWYQKQLVEKIGEERYEVVSPLIMRMTLLLLLILAIAILLDYFGFEISAITIIAIFLILIYVAARDVLSDAINGFIILFDQPFRVGDRIKTREMDTWGDVVEIGTRTTRIRTYDNRLIVIPNSDIANQKLDNYTYPDPTYRMQLDIGIKYDSDVGEVQQMIGDAVGGVEGVLEGKPVEVLLIEFGESGLTFRVRWWVVTQTDVSLMSDRINRAMIQAMGEAGIEIAFTTFNVVNLQPGSSEVEGLSRPTTPDGSN